MCENCGNKVYLKSNEQGFILVCDNCHKLYYFSDKNLFKILAIKFPDKNNEWEDFVHMASKEWNING